MTARGRSAPRARVGALGAVEVRRYGPFLSSYEQVMCIEAPLRSEFSLQTTRGAKTGTHATRYRSAASPLLSNAG